MKRFKLMFRYLKMDFQRYFYRTKNPFIIFVIFFHNPGISFSILYRLERFLLVDSNLILKILGVFFYPFYFFITYYILSYHIEPFVEMGGGLFMHNRDIVITDSTKIGKNFSIMGQTTIGTNFKSENVNICIGDNVQIGAGAKIIANKDIHIADDVTIGANAVVVKDIKQKGSVCVGIPAKVIKIKKY